jgi:hypothetical protein
MACLIGGAFALVAYAGHARDARRMAMADAMTGSHMLRVSDLMIRRELTTAVALTPCRLSDGAVSTCYAFQTTSMPSHAAGPWCPRSAYEPGGYFVDDVRHLRNPAGRDEEKQVTVAWLREIDQRLGWSIVNPDGSVNITNDTELAMVADQEVGRWGYGEAASYGIVNHCVQAQPIPRTLTILIPSVPRAAAEPVDIVAAGLPGTGIALDGVLYFPPEPVGRITTYHNVAPLDATGGHTGFAYDYHYHRAREVPGVPNLRTRVYGFMFDGYPIYGATEPDGSAVRDLDRCQGHVTARLGYHYHASNAFPYLTTCLNGAVATGMSRVG